MTQKPLVVMLGHQAHVGKDTLGEFLIKHDNFTRFGFADKLKQVVADLYGFTTDQMHGDLKNVDDSRYEITPRRVLQDFGQEQRSRFPDIWADYVFRQIENQTLVSSINNKFVITDFRFPNEYTVAKKYAEKNNWDLITVKIVRSDQFRGNFAGSTDISEIALDNFSFDFELENLNSKEFLYQSFKSEIFQTNLTIDSISL